MLRILILLLIVTPLQLKAQEYSAESVFAHNDYLHPKPFHSSYQLEVGFIEADIFFRDNALLVAHTSIEIKSDKTLEQLYLKPIQDAIQKNQGFAYADHRKHLTLMIDLKTEGISTLTALVSQLKKYPELIMCSTLTVSISGNVPDPTQWYMFPEYIYFDGRPNVTYTDNQYKRINIISTSFNSVTTWNGKGALPENDRNKIIALRDSTHSHGKKLRFWAAPDVNDGWKTLMDLNIDIIGSDHVDKLVAYINSLSYTKHIEPKRD